MMWPISPTSRSATWRIGALSKPTLMPSAAIEIDSTSNFPRHCPSAAASMCRRSTCLRRGREDASWTYPTAEQRYGENGEIRGDRGEYAKIEGDTGV